MLYFFAHRIINTVDGSDDTITAIHITATAISSNPNARFANDTIVTSANMTALSSSIARNNFLIFFILRA